MKGSSGRVPEAACPQAGIASRITHLTIAVVAFATLGALALRGGSEPTSADRSAAKGSEAPSAAVLPAAAKQSGVLENYGQIPLSFEPNAGQTDARVKFLSRGPGYTVFLTNDEAVLALSGGSKRKQSPSAENALPLAGFREISSPRPEPGRTTAVLRMHLIDANKNAEVAGMDQLPGTTNYFLGKDPRNWRTNVVNYRKVSYRDVYPGVDLVYYGNQRQLEYDFVIAPGSDPAAIKVSFAGAPKMRLDGQTGDLILGTAKGDVRFHKPVAYQMEAEQSSPGDDHQHFVESSFVLDAKNRVSFQLGSYDHSKALVIDPTLSYSTYLGGTGNDYATAVAVDSTGSAYVTGYTASANFPTVAGAYQTSCGGGTSCSATHVNAFVTKLNSSGTALIYSTYLGGSVKDYGYGIAVDASGDAFIVGTATSNDFPTTPGSYQTACTGGSCVNGDIFITELNPTGSGLVYSTYLAGVNTNQGNAIALDSSGNAYVVGYTKSGNYPVTPGVFQPICASCKNALVDAIVTKLNSSGTALVYSTFLGGSNADNAYAIAVDSAGNAYVTGYTYSTNFPTTPGAFQTTLGGPTGVFVTKINPTASAKVYSTYLNGSATGTSACAACGSSIAVDATGNAYVAGLTWETNFPTTVGSFQPNYGGGFHDGFVTKFNTTGTGLVYSTYIGGSGDDGATSIKVDSNGVAYVKGNTFSSNFPTTPGAFSTTFIAGLNSEAFVLLLNPSGSALNYSTYLGGGAGSEYGLATTMMALDSQVPPNIYVTGYTNSTTFPTTAGAFQTKRSGGYDAYVTKFAPSPNVGLSPGLNFGNQNDGTKSPPQTITVTNTGNSTLTVSSVQITGTNHSDFSQTNTCTSGGVAPQSTCAINVTFSPTISGTENATVTVTDNAPDSPESTTLTGVGVGAGPAVTLSPTSLTFATQLVGTTSPVQNVTLTNTGSSSLSITSIATTGDFAQTNNCGATVAVNASCTISVTFTPTTINTRTGTVVVTDNAPASPQTVTLTGTGTYVSYTPASLNFGSVTVGTTSAAQTITFTNNATTKLTIKSIVITGPNNTDFSETNNCGTSLGPKTSCTITVTFTPTAKGLRTADVTVSDFLGGNTTQNIPLSGTGQ
jgi:Beta-propeller repeat/Abnormal spindle-like microcephaly-assoc'd, ASPM-SPD-2-Hydin